MSEFMDMGGINHRIAAFDKRHGASVFNRGWILYEDGAYRESNPLGVLAEPPVHPLELAKRKAYYHKIIYERALKAFDEAKKSLRMVAHSNLNSFVCGPAPAIEQATAELNDLRAAALAAKAKHDKAAAAVEAAKPDADRARERMNLQNQEENMVLLATIDKIEL